MKNAWKESQELLRRRMENPRQAWQTAQRNLTWGEQQAGVRRSPADRVREQKRKQAAP